MINKIKSTPMLKNGILLLEDFSKDKYSFKCLDGENLTLHYEIGKNGKVLPVKLETSTKEDVTNSMMFNVVTQELLDFIEKMRVDQNLTCGNDCKYDKTKLMGGAHPNITVNTISLGGLNADV